MSDFALPGVALPLALRRAPPARALACSGDAAGETVSEHGGQHGRPGPAAVDEGHRGSPAQRRSRSPRPQNAGEVQLR